MPPRRQTPDVARLVSEQLIAALLNIVTQLVAGLNANQGNNQGSRERGDVTSANPKTLQEAVSSATRLTNNATRSGLFATDKASGKRKMDEPARRQFGKRTGKEQRTSGNYGVQASATEKGTRTYPRCDKCNNHHQGKCITCLKCNRRGHIAKDCRVGEKRACYECGSTDHFRNKCPRRNWRPDTRQPQLANQGNQGNQARGRVFEIGAEEARQNPDVVTGTFLLNDHYASVLFDSGADRRYVSLDFRPKINLRPQKLKEISGIEYANGQKCRAKDVIMDCTLNLTGRDFRIDLIPIQLGSFDIIVGMDWLSKNQAEICCSRKIIRIPLIEGGMLEVHGEKPRRNIKMVTCTKMRKYLKQKCITFLAHVVDKESGRNVFSILL